MSDLDAATIEELADQLAKRAGRSVDPTVLRHDIEVAAKVYLARRDLPDLRPKELADFWHSLHDNLSQAVEAYERLTQFPSGEPNVVTFALYSDLGLLDDGPGSLILKEVQDMRDRLRQHQRWAAQAGEVSDHFVGPGHKRSIPLHVLICHLAIIYKRHTGEAAGTSPELRERATDGETIEGRGGPFVRFVEGVYAVIEPEDEHLSLGNVIRKALANLRGDMELLDQSPAE